MKIVLRSVTTLIAIALLTGCAPTTAPIGSNVSESSTSDTDITAEVQAVAGSEVTRATLSEEDRVTIETSLVDPRGDVGSAVALRAIDMCNAAIGLTGVSHVNVYEADGTTFVVAGHPAYGTDCTEV